MFKSFFFFLSRIEIPTWTSNNSLAWIVDFTYEKGLWNCVQSCLKPSGAFLPSLWSALQWMLVKPIISWKWLVDCKEKKALSHLPKWNRYIPWLAQFRPVGSVCYRRVSVTACSKCVPSSFAFPLLWNGHVLERLWEKAVIVEVQRCPWQQTSVIIMPVSSMKYLLIKVQLKIIKCILSIRTESWISVRLMSSLALDSLEILGSPMHIAKGRQYQ